MGVINVTPDSFSDGGTLYRDGRLSLDLMLARARAMVDAGADVLDIGGESTRPGADAVSSEEEQARVLPVVECLANALDVVLSVDTSDPSVMRGSARVGATLLNDIRAFERPGALTAAAESGAHLCLMHRQGEPATMQQMPAYGDVVAEVRAFLLDRVAACEAVGIPRDRLILDPGFGFGKRPEHNLTLLNRLPELVALGMPVLAGLSRKSLIGQVTGRPVGERLAGSIALAALAAERGAMLIRAHDVGETFDAVRLAHAMVRERVV